MSNYVMARFMSKVQKDISGCHIWTGSVNSHGYGAFKLNGKAIGAHRYAYETVYGCIPEGQHVDHLCRNRKCVNPDHMEPVSCRTNILRGVGVTAQNIKKTHCPKGHEYSTQNTSVHNGKRSCKVCAKLLMRERRALQKLWGFQNV